jgi:flagellar hook-basal body complex protein FliE
MKINQSLALLPNIDSSLSGKQINKSLQETNDSFGTMLTQAISDVNTLQNQANQAMDSMVHGEATDLHDVMVSVEKARTSFDLLMEVRNKTISMYQELMKMQV